MARYATTAPGLPLSDDFSRSSNDGAPLAASRARHTDSQTVLPLHSPSADLPLIWFENLRFLAVILLGSGWAIARLMFSAPLSFAFFFGAAVVHFGLTLVLRISRRRGYRLSERQLAAVLLSDIILLSGLLAVTGGASNPFSVLYLVHIVLAAVLLSERWTWAMAILSVVAFALQFLALSPSDHAMHTSMFGAHLQGMWLAFSLASLLIASFVCRILNSLRERDQLVAGMKLLAARNEQFASLVTLAAGAAHELGSPLGTIMLLQESLAHRVKQKSEYLPLQDDIALLGKELCRCRAVLDEMRLQADSAGSEPSEQITLDRLWCELTAAIPESGRRLLKLSADPGMATVTVPIRSLVRALRAVVSNALRAVVLAPGKSGAVTVHCATSTDGLIFTVTDNGPGMTREVRDRCSEPFFTTQSPGRGMGLGLFLARVFAERHAGSLTIQSTPGQGTSVHLRLGPPCTAKGDA